MSYLFCGNGRFSLTFSFSAFVTVPPSISSVSLIRKLEEGDTFEVEVILAVFGGTTEEENQYLVKWKGYPIISATFETLEEVEHLLEFYPNLLDATIVGVERASALLQMFPTTETFLTALNAAVTDSTTEKQVVTISKDAETFEHGEPSPEKPSTKKSKRSPKKIKSSTSSKRYILLFLINTFL